MIINTKYNIGNTVKIKTGRIKNVEFIDAEIKRIVVGMNGNGLLNIKYSCIFWDGSEWITHDIWEEDLEKSNEGIAA